MTALLTEGRSGPSGDGLVVDGSVRVVVGVVGIGTSVLMFWGKGGEEVAGSSASRTMASASAARIAPAISSFATLSIVYLAAGDIAGAWKAIQLADTSAINPPAEPTNKVFFGHTAWACGELAAARRWLDVAVAATKGSEAARSRRDGLVTRHWLTLVPSSAPLTTLVRNFPANTLPTQGRNYWRISGN